MANLFEMYGVQPPQQKKKQGRNLFEMYGVEPPQQYQPPKGATVLPPIEVRPNEPEPTLLDKAGYFGQGLIQGGQQFGQGFGQLGRMAGEGLGVLDPQSVERYNRQVEADRAAFEQSPAGQSGWGQTGEFIGEMAPGFVPLLGNFAKGASLAGKVGVGAAESGIYGGLQYTPEGQSRFANAAGSALAGGGVTGALALPGMALRGALRGRNVQPMKEAMQQFSDSGVNPSLGQITGRRSIQGLENIVAKAPGAQGRMGDFFERQQRGVTNKVNEISGRLAPNADPETAGLAIKSGIDNYSKQFRIKSRKLYGELDKFIPADRGVDATNTLNAFRKVVGSTDDTTAPLKSATLREVMGRLESKTNEQGVVPFAELQRIRSAVGKKLGSPRLADDFDRGELSSIYSGISKDLEKAAKATGPRAEKAFQTANGFYRAEKKHIDNFLEGLNKKVEFESVYKSALSGAKDGPTKIRAIKRSLRPREWNVVAASVLNQMAKAKPGQQNAAGDVGSSGTFLTNWASLNPKAKDEIFSGTPELTRHRKDLDTIAEVSDKIKSGAQALANPSGTAGQAVNFTAYASLLSPILAIANPVAMPAAIAASAAAATGMAAANATSRLLTSPKFARWLATTVRDKSGNVSRALGRLTAIQRNADPEEAEDMELYKSRVQDHQQQMQLRSRVKDRQIINGKPYTMLDDGQWYEGDL